VTRVGAIVLAAGQSSRFRAAGGSAATKLIETLGGRPIVRMAAEAALASRARPVIVVTGHARSPVEAALAGLDVEWAYNPEFSRGLASSLRVGLAAMPADVAGALVLLGDMPWIEARLIDAIIDGFLANERALAAAPTRGGRRGNPVFLGRGLFDAAMRLEGDEGARRLIGSLSAAELVEVEAPDAGVIVDIDTPTDLAAARRSPSRDS
jgi:molybdenum cofactor cytidylyltransferase